MEEMTLAQLIENESNKEDYRGRSFTLGQALKALMVNPWILSEGMAQDLYDIIETLYDEPARMLEQYHLRNDLEAWATILDIAALDEIARQVTGLDEEE